MSEYTSNPKSCYVYLIEEAETGCTKIGISVDPHRRFGSIQVANPRKLSLRYLAECESSDEASRVESQMHEFFSERRLSGEWFSISADAVVNEVNDWFFGPSVTFKAIEDALPVKSNSVPEPRFYRPFSVPPVIFWLTIGMWALSLYALFDVVWTGYEFDSTWQFAEFVVTFLSVTVFSILLIVIRVAEDTAEHVKRICIKHYTSELE